MSISGKVAESEGEAMVQVENSQITIQDQVPSTGPNLHATPEEASRQTDTEGVAESLRRRREQSKGLRHAHPSVFSESVSKRQSVVSCQSVKSTLSSLKARAELDRAEQLAASRALQEEQRQSQSVDLPVTYTRDIIPLDKSHIPTCETAENWDHLSTIASEMPPLLDCERDFADFEHGDIRVSQEVIQFINFMESSITVNVKGHFEMPLPFKSRPNLPDNRKLAVVRLSHLKKRLDQDSVYKQHYSQYMDEMLKDGNAELATEKPEPGEYRGSSLNDYLLSGPDPTNSLRGVLSRFRRENMAVMCDVKMCHRFHVHPKDRDYLRFLWYHGGDTCTDHLEYRMNVHLFGAKSSTGCANFGLKYLSRMYEDHPLATPFLLQDFYVDDGVTSVDSVEKARRTIAEARELCLQLNLRLYKFISNRSVLESVPISERATDIQEVDLSKEKIPMERTVGVCWNIESDAFTFQISVKECPNTRREIHSLVAGAVVAVKLSTKVKKELQMHIDSEHFWCHSQVVLAYINNDAKKFHVFVSNRVQLIRDLTDVKQWQYVSTKENPANHASRGLCASELFSTNWYTGPEFLWRAVAFESHFVEPKLMDGVIRVGGRLRKSSMPLNEKHAVVLPKSGHITQLIIAYCHSQIKHQGRGQTLNEIRSKGYWILGGSKLVAESIRKCVTCRRLRRSVEEQRMADLPEDRVEPSPPFTFCGMDCFGPFTAEQGSKEYKRYGLLFTCLCSRAVHIETCWRYFGAIKHICEELSRSHDGLMSCMFGRPIPKMFHVRSYANCQQSSSVTCEYVRSTCQGTPHTKPLSNYEVELFSPASWKFREGRLVCKKEMAKGTVSLRAVLVPLEGEYLQNLQQTEKWNVPRRNLRVGDIVLVKDHETPRREWPLAVVKTAEADDDGLVRRV
ncbi:hypothetical protein HOLleu_12215 [Holothuria leucospilota]|uniref:Integrase zinc-binding domain-containing protein n=1 Tax=Holothuria leucospilota TaxID=206669 RepID=A0A9Q1CAK4_HOLLE|nr:hypothetical protein HOLleu_12215 [Holothuria leucospilota]